MNERLVSNDSAYVFTTYKHNDKSSEQRFGHVNASSRNSYFNIIFIKLVTREYCEVMEPDFLWALSVDRRIRISSKLDSLVANISQ